ncbi:MAG: SUMF1/EgtB/PvdO family nonheme iron enzyme [Victivallales bacterium]|nr:SUMF1/EgtB/PvdO family nonheme iron enzyme [Victivallales bacterium]
MTQPHSDDNQTSWTAPHSDDAEHSSATAPHSDNTESPFPTAPPSDGGVYAGRTDAPLPPGGLPLLDGKYVAQERCAGGMGVVYKCVKRSTGQVVALKTVLSEGPMSEDEIKTMRRNYDRVHSLSHDHIVRVNALEVDERKSQWYVEMDWVEGENLKEHLRKFGGDKRQEAIRILRQVAEALDYAHVHGVIHRDVKDANIMIKKETGDVVLIDFGIASRAPRPVGQDGTVSHDVTATTTTASVFAGTSGYQSPEQWLGEHAEASSDEYSLAVTAYRCLSGHLPFWSDNTGMLQEMVLHQDVPPLLALPKEANAVLKKGLAKKPSERYATCKAFMDALEKGLSSMTGGSVMDAVKTAGTEKEASFSMTDFYILSGDMEERFAESGKRKWDRGQTFGDHLDAFSKAMRGAKSATVNKDYAIAYSLFKQAESEWKWLEANEPLRKSVAASRGKAVVAQKTAVEAEAGQLAAGKLQEAVDLLKTADDNFEKGRFEDAENGFASADGAFAKAAEMARLAKRIMNLEKSIEKAIKANCLQDARIVVAELKTLDVAKAASWEATMEATSKARRIQQLEENIAKAIEAKSLPNARDYVSELKKLNVTKAASWEAAIAKAETAWKMERIKQLEECITENISTKCFGDARQAVAELKKVDAAKAAALKAAVEIAETQEEAIQRAKRIDELETTIHNHIQNKRFDKAQKDLEELEKLDTVKAASWEKAINEAEANWKEERVEELERRISLAIIEKHFQYANKAIEELRKLDAVKGASWKTAVADACKVERIGAIGALEKSIRKAIDEKRFQDARKDIDELEGLDAAKAASWEATAKTAEVANARKNMMVRTIGVVVSNIGIITSIAVIPLLIVLFRQHILSIAGIILSIAGIILTSVVAITFRAFLQQQVVTLKLDRGVKLKMVKVEKGSFQMGSNDGLSDEKPVHKVTLTQDFWMGETEITQSQYAAVMGERKNPSKFSKGGNYPVEGVSWYDAMAFCRKLTERERSAGRLPSGYGFSLPTEAQWEYAARGGHKSSGYKYSGGDKLNNVGWYDDNSGKSTHPVRQKKSNELGLYDMSGNVWEWCRDWNDRYPTGAVVDPTGPSSGSRRVLRGGSWSNYAANCCSSYRFYNDPSYSNSNLGFRVALVPVQR